MSKSPKFFFFDCGVARALTFTHTLPLVPKTSAFGAAFEHLVILECIKLNEYYRLGFRFSYLHTKDDAEIDLVVERPGKPLLCIEIKSSDSINKEDLRSLIHLCRDLPQAEAVCLCNDSLPRKIDKVMVYPWQEGLKKYFTIATDHFQNTF